ncbi:MAG: hypothetical protein M3Q37_11860 [Gemmatimonadota bacterium]|nr:hypothetical protein [Gemmatimonadota bacterium]
MATLLTACDRATEPADSSTQSTTTPAFAAGSKAVDPTALTPAPLLVGAQAECRADGRWILCHTTLALEPVNEPVFDLPCGTVYETSTDVRLGTRWYAAADSVIVKRHVRQDVEGTWSLSPEGAGPTVAISAHANWYDSQYADPNDIDSGVGAAHGEFTAQAPGYGVIAHIAGLDRPDDTHRGVFRFIDDPAVASALCEALTP